MTLHVPDAHGARHATPSPATVPDAFLATLARTPDRVAVRTLDDEIALSWRDLADRVARAARSLREMGVGRDDPVALMLTNRPELWVADLAVLFAGGVPFSLYQTLPSNDIEFVVGDAGARVAIVEAAFLERFRQADLPTLEHLFVLDAPAPAGARPFSNLVDGEPADLDALAAGVRSEDLASLIYTSGTTGHPKGVELTHAAVMAGVEAIAARIELEAGTDMISWLPSAHVLERVVHYALAVRDGHVVTTCPDPRRVAEYLRAVRPGAFIAVPRVWQKLRAGIEAAVDGMPTAQRDGARAALAAAHRKVRLEETGEDVPGELAEAVEHAEAHVLAPLRHAVGLDEARAGVGAAPTPRELFEFFRALGVELLEGYGLSETSSAGAITPPGGVRLGRIGPPLDGIELRLADDGEVLLRGAVLMRGYRNQPAATAAAIDADGWLHTGDVGTLDAGGYLAIVDRKKELIVNTGGKNMSPAKIEGELKGADPLIGHAVAIGDARPCVTALIVLDPDAAAALARRLGLTGAGPERLAADAGVHAAVAAAVERANERLSHVEQVRRFAILPGDWVPGGPELTPTMKLRRRPIAERYMAEIEAMYAGH